MRAALVFPPLVGASQPYSSLPALAGFVRDRGRHEIVQRDANVEFAVRLLSAVELRRAAGRLDERLDALHARGAHRAGDETYGRLLTASLKAPIVCDLVEEAVAHLRQPGTYQDLSRLQRARRVIRDAFTIHSESCDPASLSIAYLSDEVGTAADLERRARDVASPFRAFFEESLLPALRRDDVGALGISITFPSQIVPAITLALMARDRQPEMPVIFGGQIASRWCELPNVAEVLRWCDYLVAFEGETALDSLLSALETGRKLDRVPNLVYHDGERLVRNPVHVEDIDALPAPDYHGLPLDLYLATEPVFLLSTSRGCYWSACEFCSVSPSMRGRYRQRSIDRVRDDIATLTARHGARCLMFGDDCVRPATLRAVAATCRERPEPLSWECQVRFETALTADLLRELQAAGCRNLAFGLESYSPRVLAAMRKGVRHAEIARILNGCRRAGIAFNLQLFFGFPRETEEEARATVAFLVEQMHGAATFSVGTFELQRGSRMATRPAAFGLHVEPRSSLSIRLPFVPEADHAVAMKQCVERELAARLRFADVPLSLDAHTLLFLHYAGVAAMADQYLGSTPARGASVASRRRAPSPRRVIRRKEHQTVAVLPKLGGELPAEHVRESEAAPRRIVLYDYESDRAVELSPFAFRILQQLDGSRSIRDVIGSYAAAGARGPAIVRGIIQELLARQVIQ